MSEQELKSLYARLQSRRGDVADQALAWRLGHAVRTDAVHLADGIAAARRRRSARPAFGWALAAAVALVAVFASRELAQDAVVPMAPLDSADMIASAPEAPLFSGSFENGEAGDRDRHDGVIFDSGFGG